MTAPVCVMGMLVLCISYSFMPTRHARILHATAATELQYAEGVTSTSLYSSRMVLRRLHNEVNKAQIDRIEENSKEGVQPEQPTEEIREQLIKHACAQRGDISLPGFDCGRRHYN